MNLFECCRTCERRQVGCHGSCVEYNAARKALSALNKKKRAEQRGYIERMSALETSLRSMGVKLKQR